MRPGGPPCCQGQLRVLPPLPDQVGRRHPFQGRGRRRGAGEVEEEEKEAVGVDAAGGGNQEREPPGGQVKEGNNWVFSNSSFKTANDNFYSSCITK